LWRACPGEGAIDGAAVGVEAADGVVRVADNASRLSLLEPGRVSAVVTAAEKTRSKPSPRRVTAEIRRPTGFTQPRRW
jgi:hypothetical protein